MFENVDDVTGQLGEQARQVQCRSLVRQAAPRRAVQAIPEAEHMALAMRLEVLAQAADVLAHLGSAAPQPNPPG